MSSLKEDRLYIPSIELIKGLGLVLASFQHLRFFLPIRGEQVESLISGYFAQATPFHLFMRVLSHVIVTGFFLFIGMNICFFGYRHKEKGQASLIKHFMGRALLFILLEVLIGISLYYFMIAKGKLIQRDSIFLIATTFSTFAFIFLVIPLLAGISWLNEHFIQFGLFLVLGATSLIPYALPLFGKTMATWLFLGGWTSARISVAFPLVIWLGVACVGYGIAKEYLAHPSTFFQKWHKIGLGCLTLFVFVRIQNGSFFNLLPHLPNQSVAEFFFLVKHPPSLSFLLFTAGIVFVALFWLEKLPIARLLRTFPLRILKTFSRNGTFFYVFHFAVAFGISMLLFKEGTNSLLGRIVVWMSILALMYPACLIFQRVQLWLRSLWGQ